MVIWVVKLPREEYKIRKGGNYYFLEFYFDLKIILFHLEIILF
jgi:hypothetical protein